MVKFAKKVQEKEIAYVSASRISKFDAKQNRKERKEERKAEGKERKRGARKEHYKKINKKLGGTLTPKKKKTPKNVPRTKEKIKIKMKDIEEDVDKANDIRKRLLQGEKIRVGDRNTAMGYAFETEKAIREGRFISFGRTPEKRKVFYENMANNFYKQQLMKSMSKTIRKP
tara:strand:+ start:1122 stop:1634 length:513 start_codon:yes stop_codon:yes gene_type:complete